MELPPYPCIIVQWYYSPLNDDYAAAPGVLSKS